MDLNMDKYFKDDIARQIARFVLRLFHVLLSIPPEWSLLHAGREAKQANRVLDFLASQALKVVTDSLQLSLSLMRISSSPAKQKQRFFANQNE
jgi:hypothetical protein